MQNGGLLTAYMRKSRAQALGYAEPREEVSARMAAVRSTDTKPEMLVRRFLHACGFRYKLHDKSLLGCPDVVLPKYKTVVFIQGCFWHLHGGGCSRSSIPTANAAFWQTKLERTAQRDQLVHRSLQEAGWNVILVWECELGSGVRGARFHRLATEILANETGQFAAEGA